eukprot:10622291-Prorocentrum_lima.AAC.1
MCIRDSSCCPAPGPPARASAGLAQSVGPESAHRGGAGTGRPPTQAGRATAAEAGATDCGPRKPAAADAH